MGEFNVNKSTGGLEQTAGMPETYPAEQVMMSDGTTSVEDTFGNLGNVVPITFQGTGNGLIEGYYNNISGVAVVYYSSRTETSTPITYSMNVKSKLKTLGALNKEGTYLGVNTNSNIITVNCDKPYAVGQICFICEPVS